MKSKSLILLLIIISILLAGCQPASHKGDEDTISTDIHDNCTEDADTTATDIHNDGKDTVYGMNLSWVIQDGKYLYGDGTAIYNLLVGHKAIKYNTQTFTATPICIDELCDHDNLYENVPERYVYHYSSHYTGCKLYNSDLKLIVGDWIYYTRSYYSFAGTHFETEKGITVEVIDWDHKFAFAKYNCVTGEYRELITLDFDAPSTNFDLSYYDGVAYFIYLSPDVDDPQTEDDYSLTICTFDLDDGDITPLFKASEIAEGDKYTLMYIRDGRMYFLVNSQTVISTDLQGKDKKTILDGKDKHIRMTSYNCYLLGDYMYYASDNKLVPDDEKIPANNDYDSICVFRLNINTGETERLSECAITGFCLTEKNIVFIKYKDGYERAEGVHPDVGDFEIYTSELDGSGVKKLCEYSGGLFFMFPADDYLFINCGPRSGVRVSLTDGRIYKNIDNSIIQ